MCMHAFIPRLLLTLITCFAGLQLWAQPTVNLGPDVTNCGSILLDAGNPGATYAWSGGQNTQTVNIDSTGTYWVDVTDGTGTTRDSISLIILPLPDVSNVQDTVLCGGAVSLIPGQASGNLLLWYDSLSGGSIVHVGDTLSGNFVDTVQYFVEAIGVDTSLHIGAAVADEGTFNYEAGLRFDAFQPFLLQSIKVGLRAPASFTIYHKTDRLAIIDSLQVDVTPDAMGQAEIPLFWEIPTGNNQHIIFDKFSQGAITFTRSAVFPFSLPGLLTIERGFGPASTIYWGGFDWTVSPNYCLGSRTSFQADIIPTPSIDLGIDTVLCGNYTLDASFPNATQYVWNTNDTTATLQVTQTGSYDVLVAIGICENRDTIQVEFLSAPGDPSYVDTLMCSSGQVVLPSDPTDNLLTFWYAQATGGLPISIEGYTDTFQIQDDTTLFSTHVLTARDTGMLGPVSVMPNSANNRGNGQWFDVLTPTVLEEVTVYPRSGGSFTVLLFDPQGVEVERRDFVTDPNLARGTAVKLPLFFYIPPGNGYQLILTNVQGGSLETNVAPSYPYVLPGRVNIYGGAIEGQTTVISTVYYYMFDWVTSRGLCETARIPRDYNVSLPLQLPENMYACQDSVLRAGIPAATYRWSTGATTPDLAVDTNGVYILTVTDGGNCTVSDTVNFERAAPVGLGEDGTFCGNTLETNFGTESRYLWSTGDTTPTINTSSPDTFSVTVIEPRGCVLTDTIIITSFSSFPMVDLGRNRNTCIRDTLDAGNPGAQFLWSTNDTTQSIVATATGFYNVAVTNADGCTTRDTIAVTITPRPTANFSVNVNNLQVCVSNLSTFGSYNWNFGDGTTSSAIQLCHTYVDTGTFVITLIVTNVCGTDTLKDTIRVERPNSIDDLGPDAYIDVFPNPAQDQLSVRVRQEAIQKKGYGVTLYNMQGKQMQYDFSQAQVYTMNVQSLPAGSYFLKIKTEAGNIWRKVLITHR